VKLLSIFLLVLISFGSFGQKFQQFKPNTITLKSKGGFLIAHRANMAHLPEKNVGSFELDFSKQDKSLTRWSRLYKNPLLGVSLMYQNFGNPTVVGQGFSLFGHTSFPLVQRQKFGFLDFRLGSGVGYVTRRYDAQLNPKNNAIGSHLNGFVNLQFNWMKHFDKWHIGAGLEFTHYSNASIRTPNLGLNIPSLNFNVGCSLAKRTFYSANRQKDDPSNYEEIMRDDIHLSLLGGVKQNVITQSEPVYRGIFALQGMYSKVIGQRWKLDFALDVTYNNANKYFHDDTTYTFGQTLQLGGYVGGSIHFYNTEFIVGLGVYAYNHINPWGWVYNRLGFRYHFGDKITATVAIKAHLGIADYLEFGVGYKLWNK
jgi:Lipid A 3-O-deacylase (PagL)